MKKHSYKSWNATLFAAVALLSQLSSPAAQLPVDLGTAGNYVILGKSGISTVPVSAVTGDIAVSPIDSTAITGFSLTLDSTTKFATSPQVTGKIYAANYASPTPATLTVAINDMETAFTDAAGRTTPDFTEHGAGNIGGLTLPPGLYKWGTGVTIPTDVTLSGDQNDVWIFQVAGNITMASDKSVILSGGARSANVFWQVAGGTGVDIGTGAHFEGNVMAKAGINLNTGASINGRLLSQTAVTLKANVVAIPTTALARPEFERISRASDGTVHLSIKNTPTFQITLQHSSDLINWNPLSKPTPAVSPFLTTDTSAGNEAMRFYRAFYP